MPPKHTAGGGAPSDPGGVDFRATDDDAWYAVRLRVEPGGGGGGGSGEEEHFLRVAFCEFPGVWDERFATGDFADEVELEEFLGRFRASSVQLQDGECRRVVEGMTVCASYVFAEEDVRFYDAVVEEVCYSHHKIVEGDEVCTCTFVLFWQHGPNAGIKTPTGIENVCRIKQWSKQIDPALDLFLELSRRRIKSAGKTFCKETKGLLWQENTKETFKGKSSSTKECLRQNIDLECSFPNKLMDPDFYFVLVENLETDVAPQAIIDFIYEQTSICPQAHIAPSLLSESHTRGIIFLEAKEKPKKLLYFLHNPAHIIVSSRGRPWVITESQFYYASADGLILKSEKQSSNKPEEHNKIKVVNVGSKEYSRAKQLQELYIEFRNHVQGLHKRLALEERKLLQC